MNLLVVKRISRLLLILFICFLALQIQLQTLGYSIIFRYDND